MRRLTCIIAAAGAALLTVAPRPADAQRRPEIGFNRGDSVVVAIPFGLSTLRFGGFLGLVPRREFEIGIAEGGTIEVRDTTFTPISGWQTSGFPLLVPYAIREIRTIDRRSRQKAVEVVLRSTAGGDVRLYAPVGQEEAFHLLLAPTSAADSVRKASYRALGEVFFTGPLASFSPEARNIMLTWADITAKSTRLRSERYRDANYFAIELPSDGNVWNDLVVRQNQRIGKLLTDNFPMLKTFARLSIPHEGIGGLKLETRSCHGTAPNYTNTRCDPVEIYFPLTSLLRFAQDDITSQQLVNESIVRVANDRIEVDLSNQ